MPKLLKSVKPYFAPRIPHACLVRSQDNQISARERAVRYQPSSEKSDAPDACDAAVIAKCLFCSRRTRRKRRIIPGENGMAGENEL
jgi:hypothetical protein